MTESLKQSDDRACAEMLAAHLSELRKLELEAVKSGSSVIRQVCKSLAHQFRRSDGAMALQVLLRLERQRFNTVLILCKNTIETAIYTDDGLDGSVGESVLEEIKKARAIIEEA